MKYSQAYQKLNTEQKQAVDSIEGPLMVVAGPGTGKTQILSMRAANILLKTDTAAENILCLTFTNSAARNMSERLVELIGPDAQKIKVNTFHGFASEIMATHSEYFFNGARLSPAPDAIQLKIIEDILTKLPLGNPLALKFSGQYTLTKDVLKALALAKEAGLTPKKLHAFTDLNLEYLNEIENDFVDAIPDRMSKSKISQIKNMVEDLPEQDIKSFTKPLISLSDSIKSSFDIAYQQYLETGKTTPVTKWKNGWVKKVNDILGMHDEVKRNKWWQEIANVYELYRDQLHKNKYYDYSDMLVEVIDKFENNAELLADVQEKFNYVMIDEFQDTNEAQLRLAQLVADNPIDSQLTNIMVVGDDDQSIFKFQGAELNNMLNFKRFYPSLNTVVLKNNYRSDQKILEFSKSIIEQAEYRLSGMDKNINKSLEAQNKFDDAKTIVESYQTPQSENIHIAEKIAKLKQDKPDESYAVLARSHKSLVELASELQAKEINISYEKSNNIFELDIVKQVIYMLKIAQAIRNGDVHQLNVNIPNLILHPAWSIDGEKYFKLVLEARQSSWVDALEEYAPEIKKILMASVEQLNQPIAVIIEDILGLREDSPKVIFDYFLDNKQIDSDYLNNLSAVNSLRNLISELDKESRNDIDKFIELIDFHISNEIYISNKLNLTTGENPVQLMTVHKAKGLEFDNVFIIGTVNKNWRPKHSSRKPPANLPLARSGEDYDDYARLMYVATTRAKKYLNVSYYRTNDLGDETLPSAFIAQFDINEIDNSTATSKKAAVLANRFIDLHTSESKHLIDEMLQNYSLSVTHLINFLDITKGGPEYFFERNVLRIPQAKSTSASLGSAIHAALNYWQVQVNNNSFDFNDVVQAFEDSLLNQQLSHQEYKRNLKYGKDMLKQLSELKEFNVITAGAKGEVPFKHIKLEQAYISGNIDHVYETDKQIIVTDYKTGTPLKSLNAKRGFAGLKAWKHQLQLVFYALLLKRYRQENREIVTQMCYLESEFSDQLYQKITPEQEQLERMEKLANSVFQKIIKQDWPDVEQFSADINGIKEFEEYLINN